MFIDEDLRTSMGKAAVLAAKAAGYTNAGTVEFVLDEKNHYYCHLAGCNTKHPSKTPSRNGDD